MCLHCREANEEKAAMLLQALGVAAPVAGQALPGVGRGVVSHTTGKHFNRGGAAAAIGKGEL